MKKLLSTALLATTISNAYGVPVYTATPRPIYNSQYDIGYRHGKNTAYHNVATAIVAVGIVTFIGLAIYQYQEQNQTRWGVNDKGVVYKF